MDLNVCSASAFMNQVKSKMEMAYPPLITNKANFLVPALTAVLVRHKVALGDKIPEMNITTEHLISLWLFQWKCIPSSPKVEYLECPFIFLWLQQLGLIQSYLITNWKLMMNSRVKLIQAF